MACCSTFWQSSGAAAAGVAISSCPIARSARGAHIPLPMCSSGFSLLPADTGLVFAVCPCSSTQSLTPGVPAPELLRSALPRHPVALLMLSHWLHTHGKDLSHGCFTKFPTVFSDSSGDHSWLFRSTSEVPANSRHVVPAQSCHFVSVLPHP